MTLLVLMLGAVAVAVNYQLHARSWCMKHGGYYVRTLLKYRCITDVKEMKVPVKYYQPR